MRHRTTPSILLGVTLLASVASAVQAGVTLTFQQGVNGYYETQDTTLSLDEPGTIHGGRSVAAVGDPPLYDQALLKFDGIFGLGSNQIVPGSLVESATLTLQAWHSDLSNLQQQINVHQMLTPWSESSATFNSMGNGISANNIEAKATPVAEIRDRNTTVRPVTVDVTDTLRNWSGGKTNYGWALLGGEHGSGGWMFRSSEESNIAYRPELSVTYSEPVPQYIFSQQDLVLQSGRDQAEGGFGTSTQAMDPLFGIDRPFNPYLPEIYGNNIETQNGWESTRTWGPHAVQDGVATAYKSFDEGTRLNGQYSRVGAKPGNLALFGIGFVNDDYPRRRDLSTHSAGAVQIQNGGPDPLAINIELSYKTDFRGAALDGNSAVAINLLPTLIEAVSAAGGGELLSDALLDGVLKDTALELSGVEQQLVAKDSRFAASAEADVFLIQDGRTIGSITVESPLYDLGSGGGTHGGYLQQRVTRAYGNETVLVDPSKPLTYTLDIETHASALGTAQSHMGISEYKLKFTTPGVESVPLTIERIDPAGEADVPRDLLYATVNTPELVTGSVTLEEQFGPYDAASGEKLVVLSNSELSGFLMPVMLTDDDDTAIVRIASAVSSQDDLGSVGVQIGYTTGNEFYSVSELLLGSVFDFEANSGLAETPYFSEFEEIELEISSLPRGEGMFVFGFGNLQTGDTDAVLVLDSFSVMSVPEPSPLILLAMGALGLMACCRGWRLAA